MSGAGHNSIAREQLKAIVERIERLEEEKAALAGDIRDVYLEAKGNGFDTKILRQVIRLRKTDAAERQEQEALLDLYKDALGMLADTPLGQAAVSTAARDARVERDAKRAARNPGVRRAVKGLGTPVPLTDEEKDKGVVAAFEKNGTRMSIAFPVNPTGEVVRDGGDVPPPAVGAPDNVPAEGAAASYPSAGRVSPVHDGGDIDSQAKATKAKPARTVGDGGNGVASRASDGAGSVAGGGATTATPAPIHTDTVPVHDDGGLDEVAAAQGDGAGDGGDKVSSKTALTLAPPAFDSDLTIPEFLRRPLAGARP